MKCNNNKIFLLLNYLLEESKAKGNKWGYSKEYQCYNYIFQTNTQCIIGINRSCWGSCQEYEVLLLHGDKTYRHKFNSSELSDDKLTVLKELYEHAESGQTLLTDVMQPIIEELLKSKR